MDPNENLKEQLQLAQNILNETTLSWRNSNPNEVKLAKLVLTLDKWILQGGFLPDSWLKGNYVPFSPPLVKINWTLGYGQRKD